VDLLATAGTRIGMDLDAVWHHRLGDYLARLLSNPPPTMTPHVRKLQEATRTYFAQSGEASGEDWSEAVLKAPVIQQADHSFLLLDRETFLNNYLFALAADMAGWEKVLTIQCSTVACLSRRSPLRGSPYLDWRGRTYNVFGRSKRSFHNCAFALIPGPVEAVFATLASGSASDAGADLFLAPYVGRQWERADTAYFEMNRDLWRRCSTGLSCTLGIADDRLTAELIALHVEDAESPVHRLIFDLAVRTAFLRHKRTLIATPENISINHPEPDLFWYREPGSTNLRPLLFDGESRDARYRKSGAIVDCPIQFTPHTVAAAIRDGILFADIILIYIARCLLSGIDAIGGASQQDYVDMFRRILLACDKETGLLSDDERWTVQRPYPSRLGGAILLGPGTTFDHILNTMKPFDNLVPQISDLLNLTVGEAVGSLSSASYIADKVRKIQG
jgi:hypothetical protein